MKILHLVLKAQWYNLIEQGEKKEEYRDITPYYDKRLRNADGSFKHYDAVCFHYGYSSKTMTFEIKDIVIGEGKPEWGAEKGKKYFVIKLGRTEYDKRSI